jgi:hypothetical protein
MSDATERLNMYLNNYDNEINYKDNNKLIGIILCTDKDTLTAEYELGGLLDNIFDLKYTIILQIKTTSLILR